MSDANTEKRKGGHLSSMFGGLVSGLIGGLAFGGAANIINSSATNTAETALLAFATGTPAAIVQLGVLFVGANILERTGKDPRMGTYIATHVAGMLIGGFLMSAADHYDIVDHQQSDESGYSMQLSEINTVQPLGHKHP